MLNDSFIAAVKAINNKESKKVWLAKTWTRLCLAQQKRKIMIRVWKYDIDYKRECNLLKWIRDFWVSWLQAKENVKFKN